MQLASFLRPLDQVLAQVVGDFWEGCDQHPSTAAHLRRVVDRLGAQRRE